VYHEQAAARQLATAHACNVAAGPRVVAYNPLNITRIQPPFITAKDASNLTGWIDSSADAGSP